MAATTDRLRKGAPAFSTTLAADKGAGAASATISSATGIPTITAIDFTVGRIDANGNKTPATKAVYKATLSGSTISNLTLVEGTDQLHKAGTPVEITLTAAMWNDLVDWGLTQHNQDGTHGAVTTTSLTVSGTSSFTGAVTLPNATVTPSKLATGAATAAVATSETTTSTTYADLATTTDSVTVTIGSNGLALVTLLSEMFDSVTNAFCWVSFAASGANTIAAADTNAIMLQNSSANVASQLGVAILLTGLTTGSTIFKMKYRVQSGGGGSGTGTFINRKIAVIPL